MACAFSTSQRPKVVQDPPFFFEAFCAFRDDGMHFSIISTAKSAPSVVCFAHFDATNDVHFFNSSTSKSAPSMRSVLHFDFQISDGSASAALNGPDYVEIPSQTMLSKGAFNIRGMGLIYIYIYYQYIINISYHIMSYHFISYHIISYHVISCHIISYHIKSHHIISYLSLSVTNHQKHQPIIPSCPTVEWVTTRRLGESAPWEVMVSFLSGDVHETTCC